MVACGIMLQCVGKDKISRCGAGNEQYRSVTVGYNYILASIGYV